MKKLLLAISIGSSFALAAPVHAEANLSSGGSVGYDQQGGGFNQQNMPGGLNQQGTSGGFNQQGSAGIDQQGLPSGIYQNSTTGEYVFVTPPATSGAMGQQQPSGAMGQQQPSGAMGQQQASGAMGQQQANNPAMQGRRAVIGEVIDMREVQLRGANTKHRLVKIRNQQGQNMVVNLGDATRAPGDDFKRGTQIVAIGKESRINGDPVLFARYVGELQQAGGLGMRRQ